MILLRRDRAYVYLGYVYPWPAQLRVFAREGEGERDTSEQPRAPKHMGSVSQFAGKQLLSGFGCIVGVLRRWASSVTLQGFAPRKAAGTKP